MRRTRCSLMLLLLALLASALGPAVASAQAPPPNHPRFDRLLNLTENAFNDTFLQDIPGPKLRIYKTPIGLAMSRASGTSIIEYPCLNGDDGSPQLQYLDTQRGNALVCVGHVLGEVSNASPSFFKQAVRQAIAVAYIGAGRFGLNRKVLPAQSRQLPVRLSYNDDTGWMHFFYTTKLCASNPMAPSEYVITNQLQLGLRLCNGLAMGVLAPPVPVATAAQAKELDRWSARSWMEKAAATMGAVASTHRGPTKVVLAMATDRVGPRFSYRCKDQAPPGVSLISFFRSSQRAKVCESPQELSAPMSPPNNYRKQSGKALDELQTDMLAYTGIGLYAQTRAAVGLLVAGRAELTWSCRGRSEFHQYKLIITRRIIRAVQCGGTTDEWSNTGPAQPSSSV